MKNWSRRKFLKGLGVFGVTLSFSESALAKSLKYFRPMNIENPLAYYPNRDWENVYRNIFKPDSSFVFLCAPNDTHNCLLKTYVKNGIAVRIGPTYGYGKAEDLYGNKASHRWDPRLCQKGLGLVRKIYGDRRVKAPMIRKGFKEWVDAGFPRDPVTGKPFQKYFENRGKDKWLRVTWEDAFRIVALAFKNIAETYSGEEGSKKLALQGYEPESIEAMKGHGTQTFKFRGGMPLLGVTRIFALARLANTMALLDSNLRGLSSDESKGGRHFDSYSWHTDLPPGHPMVTGQQTNDFDLVCTEYAKLIIPWGMNWISTKMPDGHWLTEARLKGAKVIPVTVEYSSTASKGDEVIIIRPGTDPAFALGLAQVIISKDLFDKDFVVRNTDLPFLIRMDNLQPLRPEDVIKDFKEPELQSINFLKKGENPPPAFEQKKQYAPISMKDDFKSHMILLEDGETLVPVSRDEMGKNFNKNPKLRVNKKIKLLNGMEIVVRSNFDLLEEYLNNSMTPDKVSKITGAPQSAIISLAKQIASNPEKTLIAVGMGPNQFFNSDLKDRAIFLVGALTRNIGFPGGNVGSYAGNYKTAMFSGIPLYVLEDPFNLNLEIGGKPKVSKKLEYESLHYFNYGDRPLKVGNRNFTGKTHTPTPTKTFWQANSNSSLGNIKWHYDVVNNTLPKVEMVIYSDWWWTASCEHSDIVFAVDSWAEFKYPDMTASCTNPFFQVFPVTPLKRIFDTKSDIEIVAGVSKALAELTGDNRFVDAFKFVHENKVEEYLQRIINGSTNMKGYKIENIHEKAKEGIPTLINARTYPRVPSYEEAKGEKPWYTKSGRLEFYRPEKEFIEQGENMIVYREPIDSTFYEPNVIVGIKHDAIRALTPKDFGFSENDLSCELRQVRNILRSPEELLETKHPLMQKDNNFKFIYHTPKYRHGTHTTPVDTDFTGVWFGPFGDIYRHDKRMPSIVEGYADINPLDCKELGIEDGDYIYVDADPEDRPFRGWQDKTDTKEYKAARLLLRARYYPGTPRGVVRTWYNMYGATVGSVIGQETRADGLAKNPITNYQSMYRGGSHQSATRAWLHPTLMTDSLVRKQTFGQVIGKGFEPDVHCPVGAPREAFVKITKAEPGGINGNGKWRPASLGYRPTYENASMKAYLKGQFIKKK
ncbi:MAG: hypothetical protein KatS3mg068_2090 [Candidatus Sericytochromatia bacterium]|nr:MAG: hypothetical protein KatS3mg068_2090 [Candidatus Sericytochromatia bacterium]